MPSAHVRAPVSDRLHCLCRDCAESAELYVTTRQLRQKALGGTHHPTRPLCLRCLANRLAPRQLFSEDLSDGTDGTGTGSPPIGDWDWTDPASGSNFGMRYEIRFPAYEGPPAVRCTMDFFCDSDELPEAFLDTCDDRMAWLTDYCREHGLDLDINGETVLRRGEEIEG